MEAGSIERVPRTPAEEALLVQTKPSGWEYMLWGAVLLRLRDGLEPAWQEHEQRSRRPATRELSEHEALDQLSPVFDSALSIIDKATATMKSPDAQEQAFGKPGEPGDPDQIEALAASLIGGYQGLLEWSASLREEGIPTRFRRIYDAASDLADLPLNQIRNYVDHVVAELDQLPAALRDGRPIEIQLLLTLSIDAAVQERFQQQLDEAQRQLELDVREVETTAVPAIAMPAGLGFFESRRIKKSISEYQARFATWQEERNACAERLALAKSYHGEQSTQIILKRGEAVYAAISGASLIEDRRGAGQWRGRSSGFSFPIASVGGRSIRYRTGSTRGHYVQGAPIPTAIDVGTLYVTNQRAVFQGAKQTRECRFDKLVGYQHTPDGSTIFSVSNRQRPTQVHYGIDLSGWFDFRLDLALAQYQDSVSGLVQQLESDLAAVDAARPIPPALGPARS
jgi:hypothetical protein